jgi:hypothetical protein
MLMSSNASPAERGAGLFERIALVLAMGVGSVMLWFGWPLGLIYAVSKMVDSTQPTMGPYVILLFGIPLGMVGIGKVLAALDRHYNRRTMQEGDRYRPGWLKSMRGERKTDSNWKVLDIVMLWSVCMAMLGAAIFFIFFPSSPI